MKKKMLILLMTVLIVSCAGLAGCGKEKAKETSSAPAAVQEKGGSNELADVMKSAREASEMSFEMVSASTSNGKTVNVQGKYWISGKKMRMEAESNGLKFITIVDANGETFMYNPGDKTVMKLSNMQEKSEMPNQWSEKNDQAAYKIVGHEKMDGYDCVVVTVNETDGTNKMWLRKDIGMPVKMEAKSADESMVVQYKNYNIGKQADDLFKIPADAKVLNMTAIPDVPKTPKQ